LSALRVLREAHARAEHMLSIFTYGFKPAQQAFADAQCSLHALTNYTALMEVALKNNYIQEADLNSLQDWQKNPKNWSDLRS
ncbi:MAG: orotate phosphoribosyltransferase, partial [Bacteroidota bacterium]